MNVGVIILLSAACWWLHGTTFLFFSFLQGCKASAYATMRGVSSRENEHSGTFAAHADVGRKTSESENAELIVVGCESTTCERFPLFARPSLPLVCARVAQTDTERGRM